MVLGDGQRTRQRGLALIRALFVLALLTLPLVAHAEQDVIYPPGVKIQDEGAAQGRAQTLNCTGSGIACSVSAGVATLNATGGSGTFSITAVEIDFATCGQGLVGGRAAYVCKVTVTDAAVSTSSKLIATQSGKAATGKSADENEMDALTCRATPGTGNFVLYCTSLDGMATGTYVINYTVA